MEKISDNQIKCTLTGSDLADRHLSIAELAYGGEKARMLFNEMVNTANDRFGFHPDHSPLMIEAVPMSDSGLTVFLTSINDADELDLKFAKFAPSVLKDSTLGGEGGSVHFSLEEALRSFNQFLNSVTEKEISPLSSGEPIRIDDVKPHKNDSVSSEEDVIRAFIYNDISDAGKAAAALAPLFNCISSLYRSPSGDFYLVIHKAPTDNGEFMRACNTLIEYGNQVKPQFANESYYKEHYETVYDGDALLQLGLPV